MPRPIAASMTLGCGLAAAVQLNDPDPLPWLAAWGFAAALGAAALAGRYLVWPTAIAGVAYALALAVMLPALADVRPATFTTIGMASARDETAREALGLVVCLVWTTVLWSVARRRAAAAR